MNLYGDRQMLVYIYIYIFSIDWVMGWYLLRGDSRPHWDLCGMVQELNFLREKGPEKRFIYN